MVYSNQDPNKSYALHLLDISLKALLIYRFPVSFPTPCVFFAIYLLGKPGHLSCSFPQFGFC